MKIAIKDANILIDLANCDLVEACMRLPYEFVTTELVLLQLRQEAQWAAVEPFVATGLIRTATLSADEEYRVAVDPLIDVLGHADMQVLWLAMREQAILLTGDLKLRKEASRRRVLVHGLLWILDELIETRILAAAEAAKRLRLAMAGRAFLPQTECDARLKRWETAAGA
ncbi:MAG: hypothetical protein IAE97_14210 [Chthoniobacterales bacterium]|nr:hypothetical protein [Chthoniobacterales bacterium]